MPIDYGLSFLQATSSSLVGVAMTPIAVVGTAATGTALPNKLYRVRSVTEALDLFGAHQSGVTIPRTLEILTRYGCGNIIVVKVPAGADAAATETAVIGGTDGTTGDRTGLQLLRDTYSQLGTMPEVILTPSFNSAAIVTAALAVAATQGALYIANFTANMTVADAVAARATATALGTKNGRLIPAFTHLKQTADPTILEPLATHVAAVIARLDYETNYGRSPGSQPLRGVTAPDINLSMSYTDETADTEKLADVGVMTINRQNTSLVTWGHRNALYMGTPQNKEDTLTFINAVRINDRLPKFLGERAQKFLDLPSNYRTARLLEESFDSGLSVEVSKGAISFGKSTFQLAESDLSKGQLKYLIEVAPIPPTRLINIDTVLSSFDYVVNLTA